MKLKGKSFLVEIILLAGIALFFCFYHLPQLYSFEFDQERDFNIVKSIVVTHKFTLIGPRVVSSAGFYLGPWYFYAQIPFFVALFGNPLYGAYFVGFVNISISFLTYFLVRKLTGSRLISFLAAVLWVSGANRYSWNVAFVPLFFLLFYSVFQSLKKITFKTLWLLSFIFFFSLNFHPQMIFLFPLWLYFIHRFFKEKNHLTGRRLLLWFLAFAIPFAPLLLFDLRHDFINTNALLHFLTSSSQKNSDISFFRFSYSLRQFSTAISFLHPVFQHNLPLTLGLLGFAVFLALRFKELLPLIYLPLVSIFVLSFYREITWPEYYHYLGAFSLFLLLFMASKKISPLRWSLVLLTLYLVFVNFRRLTTFIDPSGYEYKKKMILYMLEKNRPYEKLNIVNDFTFGEGLGFTPIRDFYESKTGSYNPDLTFYVSYANSPKHNSTKEAFGLYAVSLLRNEK